MTISHCEGATKAGQSHTAYRDSSGPNSRPDAHCATIVGGWEEPSGESRLKVAGLAFSITYKELGYQAWLLRVLGEIHWRMGEQYFAKANGYFKQSLDIAAMLEMRPLLARCQIGIATLCEKTGKQTEARSALNVAETLCEDMGMTFWLDEIEAARIRV